MHLIALLCLAKWIAEAKTFSVTVWLQLREKPVSGARIMTMWEALWAPEPIWGIVSEHGGGGLSGHSAARSEYDRPGHMGPLPHSTSQV